jgi:hypothetical protein
MTFEVVPSRGPAAPVQLVGAPCWPSGSRPLQRRAIRSEGIGRQTGDVWPDPSIAVPARGTRGVASAYGNPNAGVEFHRSCSRVVVGDAVGGAVIGQHGGVQTSVHIVDADGAAVVCVRELNERAEVDAILPA